MLWLRRHGVWIAAWLLVSALGAVLLARLELARIGDAFETDMRIAHRLLSQRVVQHDAVMATLALLQPPVPGAVADTVAASTLPRLPSVYPQILAVLQRPAGRLAVGILAERLVAITAAGIEPAGPGNRLE